MVLSKADANIALYYESHLTEDEDLKVLGNQLRQRLKDAVETLLTLKDESKLLSDNEVLISLCKFVNRIYCLCIFYKLNS